MMIIVCFCKQKTGSNMPVFFCVLRFGFAVLSVAGDCFGAQVVLYKNDFAAPCNDGGV
jgi:hypothetical protein